MAKPYNPVYKDGRPTTHMRLDAADYGIVYRHGDGPGNVDMYGARDVWVYQEKFHGNPEHLYMNYDAAGETGWLATLATSHDGGRTWKSKGAVLDLGKNGTQDSASASYGSTYENGPGDWHMFYLGTPNTSPPPDRIPNFPYNTMKAHGSSPQGPWTKQYDVTPFLPTNGTYYSVTASPGYIVKNDGQYLQFFSAATENSEGTKRTISLAKTDDLNGPWEVQESPLLPVEEQIENSSLYYEPENNTWFLFTNHVADDEFGEYTDAIWVYWTQDLFNWDPANKASVLDRSNCAWSPYVIGLPSVVKIGNKLALFYDGRATNDTSHMGRDVGLAHLDLPLHPPSSSK